MRIRTPFLAAAALLAVAAIPASACDPEEMNAHLSAVCRAALDPTIGWARAVREGASAAERAAIDRALTLAEDACETGDPTVGARESVRLARLVGRIEARLGVAAPIWPGGLAAR